ncbi:unnamed protein product [Durusdinium trenchii]|uniref:Chloroplastic (Protein MATERNAL EFFECT EMBRYO ARREST 40) n=2 Tax=Durusdinium trenchii TaxID=1381693 RepID=A0ABP0NHZ7_9DINO
MACRRGACWERSLSLLEEAERQEVSLDDVSRNGIVSALVSGGHVQMALKQAESASNFNSILMALCRNEMDLPAWTWTLQVLEKMRASNMTPNLGTFKAAASASKSRPDMVLPIFRNLKKHFALEILDGTALNMLLSSLEKCHRWQDALFHLRTFSCTSLKRLPDLAAYNSAISACAKVARWTLALSIAAEIGSNEWDKITLGSLVLACQTGRWTLALWLLEQGRLQHIQPNQIAIHSAIVACGGRHWPWAIHLLEESTAQRVVPDASMLGAVISSCEKGHQWSRCLHLLSTAFGMQCPPDIAALTSSISACAKAHRWEATLQLVREVIAFWNVLPDSAMTGAALTAFFGRPSGQHGQLTEALLVQQRESELELTGYLRGFVRPRGGFVAEDSVDLRDLPIELARATVSCILKDAFIGNVNLKSCSKFTGRSFHGAVEHEVHSNVQGLVEELRLVRPPTR